MKEPPFSGIELIEQRDDLGVVQAMIAEPLPDMGPVFLFYVSIVVFVIGPASCKLDRPLSFGKVSQEVVV